MKLYKALSITSLLLIGMMFLVIEAHAESARIGGTATFVLITDEELARREYIEENCPDEDGQRVSCKRGDLLSDCILVCVK